MGYTVGKFETAGAHLEGQEGSRRAATPEAVMLSPRGQSGQSGLEAKILAKNLGVGLKHLASAWPRSRCLIM